MQKGTITVTTGVMGSGKSLWLINEVKKRGHGEYKTLNFVPDINHRPDLIWSRLGEKKSDLEGKVEEEGISVPAMTVKTSDAFKNYVEEHLQKINYHASELGFVVGQYKVIVSIDEAQFIDSGIVKTIQWCQDRGLDVNVTGLALNYRGEPFSFRDGKSSFGDLLAIADNVRQEHATCQWVLDGGVKCGRHADRTQRYRDLEHTQPSHYKDDLIVADARFYIASCKYCHTVPGKF